MCLPGLAEQVHKLVEDARAKGARVLAGGKLMEGAGQFYPPTILADVTQDMLVWREETFGPLMTVAKCSSDAHAVCCASCIHYFTFSLSTCGKLGIRLVEAEICPLFMLWSRP
jgi:acyl-CoA reductase-like NAD-dependent aldehyde dehydrogenase